MKKIIILFIILISYTGIVCELDYQMQSEFGFGGIGELQYSNGKILASTDSGYMIYEIQENGDIENISSIRSIPGWSYNYYSDDKLGKYRGYINSDDPVNFPSFFSIYDLSTSNEQAIIYEIQIESDNMFLAELFENYFIRKTGEVQYTVFDYENYQPISQVDNISLVYNSKYHDQGAVLFDHGDNCYYYYIIDDEGSLHKKYNLGVDERKVAFDGNKMIAYSIGDVKFYNITATDSLEYLGTFYLSQALSDFDYRIAYQDDRITFTSYEGTYPIISKLYLYDVSNVSSVLLLDTEDISNRPYSQGVNICSLVQNNNTLYLSSSMAGTFLLKAVLNNDMITLEDIGQSSIIDLSSIGMMKNDIYYVQNTQRNCKLNTYSFQSISNIQEIPNNYPENSMYRFLENGQKVVRYDELTGIISLYDFSGDEMILEATYATQPPITQDMFSVLKWDGTHFIYRSISSLYSLKYEDGEFIPTWSIINNDNYYTKYGYAVYNNYLYEHNKDTGVLVYEYNEEELNQINSLSLPFNIGTGSASIVGDILTLSNKIVDLSIDPINLSCRYNLNQSSIFGGALKYHDYFLYYGEEKIMENGTLIDYQKGVSIYKIIDDIPVRVGQIVSDLAGSVQILPGGEVDNFDLLVYHQNYYAIYSCQATPNGDLEITPVPLNASNYPNPFNPETTISYDISQQGKVSVDIYNLKGQKVKSLLNDTQEAGQHKIVWQGDNNDGKRVSSGTYFYKVKSGEEEIVKKMLLVK